ncbi:hypothetical protein DL769_005790 [Monosporascus sp. CRB-8-3]|nr:hypothetical protein DL769_005790 [Monosporascus sp. CRB-8-3]
MARHTSQSEILIAVIGVTGAGKTTFISKATGRNDLEIGYGVDSFTFSLDGKKVTLIDTPGFDDTYQSDADILQLVANYMAQTYEKGILLTGLILLQPINQNRLQGSEMKRTRLFKKILGENAYSRVVVATTMWNQISDYTLGQDRETERKNRPDVWGDMVSRGAEVVRHDDNKGSAVNIIKKLMNFSTPIELQIQRELVDHGGRVSLTSAGKQLDEDLGELIATLKQEIESLKKERDATRDEITELQHKLYGYEREQFGLGSFMVQGLVEMAASMAGLGFAAVSRELESTCVIF